MNIVNLVHALQPLDKVLGICLQLQERDDVDEITSVLKFSTSMEVPAPTFLFEVLLEVSDRVVLTGNSFLNDDLIAVAETTDTPVARTWCPPLPDSITNRTVRSIAQAVEFQQSGLRQLTGAIDRDTVLLKSHWDVHDYISKRLIRLTRKRGGRVLSYIDGTLPPNARLPVNYWEDAKPELTDVLLLYSPEHAADVESVGYDETFSIGYPLLYPAWRSRVEAYARRECPKTTTHRVVVFTRGEHGQYTLMTKDQLADIICAICEETPAYFEDVEILFKPHPVQDIAFVEDLIDKYQEQNVAITYKHPSVLAASADLVVTTWSTAILSGLNFGVPSIEYFELTDEFYQAYPDGSGWQDLGVLAAETRADYVDCLEEITAPDFETPAAAEMLDHSMELSVFDPDRGRDSPVETEH